MENDIFLKKTKAEDKVKKKSFPLVAMRKSNSLEGSEVPKGSTDASNNDTTLSGCVGNSINPTALLVQGGPQKRVINGVVGPL